MSIVNDNQRGSRHKHRRPVRGGGLFLQRIALLLFYLEAKLLPCRTLCFLNRAEFLFVALNVLRERAKNTLYVRGAHDNTAHELPKRRLEEQKIEKKLILIVRHLHRLRVTTP